MNGFDVALFRDFGFPALLVGILLWVYFSRLERLIAAVTDLRHQVENLIKAVERLEDELKRDTPKRGTERKRE